MRLLVQRVLEAAVTVDGQTTGAIGKGLLVMTGFGDEDGPDFHHSPVFEGMARKLLDLRIFPELTALENVLLKNQLTHHKKRKDIVALFETLGIADKIDVQAGKLSFGQQQRVAFIRSLCQPFDFIFLDEPVSHLDDENGIIMSRLLTEEAEQQQAGIIVTSIGKHLPLDYNEVFKL